MNDPQFLLKCHPAENYIIPQDATQASGGKRGLLGAQMSLGINGLNGIKYN